jgi:hypothetical protein
MRDGLDAPKSNCSFLSLDPLSLLLVCVCISRGIIGNVSCCTRIQGRAEMTSMYSSTKSTLSSRTFMIKSVLITSLVVTVASSRLPNDPSLSVRRSRSSFTHQILLKLSNLGETHVSSLLHRGASSKPCVATLSSSPDDKPPDSQLLGDVLPGARCVCVTLRTRHERVFP